ncbi:alpha/beta fold hydrolase [Nocardia sp. GP40]|uniref:alpha/beta fold hydrolase n=1 Tax=Nocardia sp. GP40 TaxID=3156268 RepID=UPI003D2461DE
MAVGDGHEIYWEESGNPDGIPAVYLHGGPGGGLGTGAYRTKFDPARFRIIGFDQRGCGRSIPHVTAPGYDLGQNTTPDLIDDIERIREHLHVDRWLVNGASWGSTLALAYAQAHPARVRGIVLTAVTTTSRFEVDWITETVGAIYPEAWDRLASHAEQAGIGYRRGDGRIIEACAQLMTHTNPAVRERAARAWVDWEDHHISIGADGIPATLIHGRRDVSSPAVVAWRLHRAWPGSELVIDEGDGHGGTAMVQEWRAANTRHADRIDAEPDVR